MKVFILRHGFYHEGSGVCAVCTDLASAMVEAEALMAEPYGTWEKTPEAEGGAGSARYGKTVEMWENETEASYLRIEEWDVLSHSVTEEPLRIALGDLVR